MKQRYTYTKKDRYIKRKRKKTVGRGIEKEKKMEGFTRW